MGLILLLPMMAYSQRNSAFFRVDYTLNGSSNKIELSEIKLVNETDETTEQETRLGDVSNHGFTGITGGATLFDVKNAGRVHGTARFFRASGHSSNTRFTGYGGGVGLEAVNLPADISIIGGEILLGFHVGRIGDYVVTKQRFDGLHFRSSDAFFYDTYFGFGGVILTNFRVYLWIQSMNYTGEDMSNFNTTYTGLSIGFDNSK